MKQYLTLALITLVLYGPAAAAPAAWYKWRSKLNGQEFCAQVSPGAGWEKLPVPYQDARCEKARERSN